MNFKIGIYTIILGLSAFLLCFAVSHKQQKELFKSFFNKNNSQKICYIYAPGLMANPLLMGRYCPQFVASTGEIVTWENAGHVIGYPHYPVTFSETYLYDPNEFSFNPISLLTHNLRDDLMPLIARFFQDSFNFKVVPGEKKNKLSILNYGFDFGQANIAQAKDIKSLCTAYQDCKKQMPDHAFILFGDSRGAATIFNFLATHKPLKIKAAIMEGIFDTVPHCIKHFLYSDKDERAETRLHDLLSLVMRSYNKNGPFPRDYLKTIPKDVPLLLVTSLKDGLVSPQCTIYLYDQLYKAGYKKVHLLVLKHSLHPIYMLNEEDKQAYQATVHAFYKKYQLPYNDHFAHAGERLLKNTQPNPHNLLKEYNLASCPLCAKPDETNSDDEKAAH